MLGDRKRGDVQRDFLKYTSRQILKELPNRESAMILRNLQVDAVDRRLQVWEINQMIATEEALISRQKPVGDS